MYRFMYANPFTLPDQYDFLNVSGVLSPGVFKLDGGDRPYKWDVKDSAGTQGATETYRGLRPSDGIKGKFLFWNAAQIDEFYGSFVNLFHYDAAKSAPKPINVLHPVLAANGITNLVVTNVGPLTPEDKQLWSVTVEFIEYLPSQKKNATTTPVSLKSAPSDKDQGFGLLGKKPTADEVQDAEIKRLLDVANTPL